MFSPGALVVHNMNPDKIYMVLSYDDVSSSVPMIKIQDVITKEIFDVYDFGFKEKVTSDDVLRYGRILTNDEFKEANVRIRTIRYNNRIFYLKMKDGEVVKYKELTT